MIKAMQAEYNAMEHDAPCHRRPICVLFPLSSVPARGSALGWFSFLEESGVTVWFCELLRNGRENDTTTESTGIDE